MDGRTDGRTGAPEPGDLRALAEEVARRRDVDSTRRLTATYNDAWDDGHCDDWVAVFTPDAQLRRTTDGWQFTHRSFAPDSWWAS